MPAREAVRRVLAGSLTVSQTPPGAFTRPAGFARPARPSRPSPRDLAGAADSAKMAQPGGPDLQAYPINPEKPSLVPCEARMYRRLATDAALGVLVAALCARVAWTAEAAADAGRRDHLGRAVGRRAAAIAHYF